MDEKLDITAQLISRITSLIIQGKDLKNSFVKYNEKVIV